MIVVMIYAEILSFMFPGALEEIMIGYGGAVPLTQVSMLIAAIVLEIAIAIIKYALEWREENAA